MQLFNGIPDWNGNGRPDPGDMALEYMIFNAIFNEPDDSSEEDPDEEEY